MLDTIRMQYARFEFNRRRDAFYRTMATDLEQPGSKQTITDADRFTDWAQRSAERNLRVAAVHHAVARRLRNGMKLSQALQPIVPVEDVLVLDGGETKGALAPALRSVIEVKKASDEMRGVVLLSLAAPLLAGANLAALALLNGYFLFPDMLRNFALEYWDAWAVPAFTTCIWLTENCWVFLIPAVLAVLYLRSLRTWTGPVRQFLDRFPPYSAHRDRTAATLVQVIGSLVASQLTIDEALSRIAEKADRYTAWHVSMMRQNLRRHGDNVVKVLDTGIFADDLLDEIADAAKTRVFDKALLHLSTESIKNLVGKVKIRAMLSCGAVMMIVAVLYFYVAAVMILGTDAAGNRKAAAITATSKKF
uniref:hypothetical protein n=1 Tax=Cupriavidus gilardii TaxID=82541 RepID=UPI00247A0870|nr:hypothetical protein [Cupriavidus gilardii]WDE72708.1 hypothetical protein [Cupriavidus gilardii]